MPDSLGRSLLSHLRGQQDTMVDFLRRLALLESPSLDPSSQGPVFALLEAGLAAAGYRTRRLAGRSSGGQLFAAPARRARGRRAQLLVGHSDTVWAAGTLARMPVTLTDGRLTGPGVYDMKGGLTQALFALRALAELGLEPPATPLLFVNSDEEVGSGESTRTLRLLARHACRVFVLEPSLGPEGRVKTRRKGVGRFTITVRGRAAHAGLEPEKGASAILEMANLIARLHGLSDPARGITVNVGKMAGGVRGNVVAPEAQAEVDVRVPSQSEAEAVERAIRALRPTVPGTRIEIAGAVDRPPLEPTTRNQALFATARRAAAELGFDLGEGAAGGASDGNTTSLLAPTLDGLGAVGDGAHADHELVWVDRLPERAALLALLLLAPVE